MHLAAMMRLMIEHMGDEKPYWLAQLGLGRAGIPGQIAFEGSDAQSIGPVDHDGVERRALALQVVPVAIERHRFRNAALRAGRAGEPAHPDAIRPQQMAERRMDRAEARAGVA